MKVTGNNEAEIRSLPKDGWYWIDKSIIKYHIAKIGATRFAVYSFLAACADSDQKCFPSQKHIADQLGFSRATVNKAIKILEEEGLIRKVKKDRYHCVYQLLRCKAEETQVSTPVNSGVQQVDTNDNKLTRINNDNVRNEFKSFFETDFVGFKPQTKEDLLALDVATALNDTENLPYYLSVCQKYPEPLIRKILGDVKEVPAEKIKRSRGALFNHLIQKHAQEISNHSGN